MTHTVLAPVFRLTAILFAICLMFGTANGYAQTPQEAPDAPSTQLPDSMADLTLPAVARPSPVLPAHLSLGKQTRTFDRTSLLWTMASFGATIADIESTRHAIESCGLRETNPLYGSNPSRARLYALNLPITSAQNVLGWYMKKKYPKSRLWMLLPSSNTAVHSVGFINNIARCH